jgi:Cu2+-exporting ATPase
VGEDTSLSQIIAMVSDAAASKAPVARMADRICGVFVPAVMIAAAAVMCFWMIFTLVQTGSADAGLALQRGISVLVVSCPCALGLATPVAIMVGSGKGARNGILFKNAQALQETGNIRIVALDKTGTITNGKPEVTEIYAADSIPGGGKSVHSKDSIPGGGKNSHSKDSIPEQSGLSANRALLQLAASLESKSGHPLAQAVCRKAEAEGLAPSESTGFTEIPGQGLSAVIGGKVCFGGNLKFIREHAPDADDWAGRAETLAQEGKTPLFFAEEGRMLGLLAVADTMKPDSAEAIRQLRGMGLRVVMLTGDNRRTAEAVGRLAGVDEVVADVLPAAKEAAIRTLQKKGKTAMVGDGINDAPALTRADVGIAIGAGTDVAIDAADVVLAKSGLSDVAAAIRLSRATYRNILENLFWALIYNVLLIPLAAGAYLHWGLSMNPMWGAAAMSMSSVFVVSNALRLNLLRLYDRAPGREEKAPGREEKTPGREEKAPGREEKAPGRDEKTPDRDEKTHGREEKAPGRDENTSGRGERNRCEKENNIKKENTEMTKTVRIEGMMCEHCEARVKKTLEALAGVEKAEVSHKSGTAVLTLAQEVSDDVIREAVEAQDYKFVSAK